MRARMPLSLDDCWKGVEVLLVAVQGILIELVVRQNPRVGAAQGPLARAGVDVAGHLTDQGDDLHVGADLTVPLHEDLLQGALVLHDGRRDEDEVTIRWPGAGCRLTARAGRARTPPRSSCRQPSAPRRVHASEAHRQPAAARRAVLSPADRRSAAAASVAVPQGTSARSSRAASGSTRSEATDATVPGAATPPTGRGQPARRGNRRKQARCRSRSAADAGATSRGTSRPGRLWSRGWSFTVLAPVNERRWRPQQ